MKTREQELYLIRQQKNSLITQTNSLLSEIPGLQIQGDKHISQDLLQFRESDKLLVILQMLEKQNELKRQIQENEDQASQTELLIQNFKKLEDALEIQDSYAKLNILKNLDLEGMDEQRRKQVQATTDLLYLKLEEEYGSYVNIQSHEISISKTKKLLEGKALFSEKFHDKKQKLTTMLIQILTSDELSLRIEDQEGRVKLIQYYAGFQEENTDDSNSDLNQFQQFAIKCETVINFCFQVVEFELLPTVLPLIDEQLQIFLKAIPTDQQRDSVIYLQNLSEIDLVLTYSNYMKSILESFDILAAKKVLSGLRRACISDQQVVYFNQQSEYACFKWTQAWITQLIPLLNSKSKDVILGWALDILELLVPSCKQMADLRTFLTHANSIQMISAHLFDQINKLESNSEQIEVVINTALKLKQLGFKFIQEKMNSFLNQIGNLELLSQGNRVIIVNEVLQNIELTLMKTKEILSTTASFKEYCSIYGRSIDQLYIFMLTKLFEIETVNKFEIRAIVDVMERAKSFYGSFTFGEMRYEKRRIELAANQIQYRMKYIPSFSRFSQALRFISCENLGMLQALLKREDRFYLTKEEVRFLIEVVFEETIKRNQIIEHLMKSD